jgi:hypothetical protein
LLEKASEIADCLENHFTPHNQYDENHEWRLVARGHETVDSYLERVRLCDVEAQIDAPQLGKTSGIYGISSECLRHLPRRPLVQITHLFNHCLWLTFSIAFRRKQNL